MQKPKYVLDLTPEERERQLEQQRRECKWHRFVEGNLILKMGLVDKRKVSIEGVIEGRRTPRYVLDLTPRVVYKG